MDSEMQITLWGAKASGKSWLIDAFCQQIGLLNRAFKKVNYPCDLSLIDRDTGKRVSVANGPKDAGTADTISPHYLFVRRQVGKELSHQVSSHAHKIDLIDSRGVDVTHTESLEAEGEKEKQQAAQKLLQNSEYIIAALEPGSPATLPVGISSTDPQYRTVLAEHKQKWLGYLQHLRTHLKGHCHIAMCLTKFDLFPVRDVPAIITRWFGDSLGDQILVELNKFETESSHQVQYFYVSAAGFIERGGQRVSNIQTAGSTAGQLIDVKEWRPEGVDNPFFWLFELQERKRLMTDTAISPNAFDLLYKPLKIHNRQRIESYVSYPVLKQIAMPRLLDEVKEEEDIEGVEPVPPTIKLPVYPGN